MDYVGLVIAHRSGKELDKYVFQCPEFSRFKKDELIVVTKSSGFHEVMVVDNYIDLGKDSEELGFFLAGMGVNSLKELNTVYGSVKEIEYKEESEVKA